MRPDPFEPVRFVTAILWVGALSLWTFYQGLFFYSGGPWPPDSLTVSSAILRTVRPLWFASFFPALAFGVAWYVFAHRRVRRTTPLSTGLDRLTVAQTYASLCVAICAFVLNYRILPILSYCTLGEDRVSSHLLALNWDTTEWLPVAPVLEQQAMIGALAAALVATQAWGLVPRLGGSRRRLFALLTLLLLGGCGVSWFGVMERLPSTVPRAIFELDVRSPASRGILLGDEEHRDEARRALAQYFFTHSDAGTVASLRSLRKNWLPEWRGLPWEELAYRRCELCRLPGVAVWTMTGLPLRLVDEPPSDAEPTIVIEIPRRADYGRLYDPREVYAMKTMPITEIGRGVRGSDWVIAKIDFTVEMGVVRDLFSDLREAGIRRVDLAVVPYGFRPLPEGAPVLSFAELADTAPYTPRPLPRSGIERIIVIKKYIPPRPQTDLRPRCEEVDEWDLDAAWSQFALDPAGSLPGRVGLPVGAGQLYGEFVALLQGVVTGGAESIVVEVREVTEPGSGLTFRH